MSLASLALFAIACLATALPVSAQTVLHVNADKILRSGADQVVGVNLNYLRDADANRPDARPLSSALQEIGARWLRYPGGEKSDFHLWSAPPYVKPAPLALGWYEKVPGARLNFDEYIALARQVGARPYVVVGYDNFERTGRTRAQWLENAVSWVRYNQAHHCGVRYWEIGNENWHNQTATPVEMAAVVGEFSRAMKAVDPTILIGASGNAGWWPQFLPLAAPALDFLSVSQYNAWNWKSYDYLLQHPDEPQGGEAFGALDAIDKYAPINDRARLQVVVAETNSKDYSEGGWNAANSMGHAIVTFETLGRLMREPRIASAMVWTTRWIEDEPARASQWYALGAANEILATGRAIELWKFAQSKMIAVEGTGDALSAYATKAPDDSTLTLWIVNRGAQPLQVAAAIEGIAPFGRAQLRQLAGANADDTAPTWAQLTAPITDAQGVKVANYPPFSVSVISLSH